MQHDFLAELKDLGVTARLKRLSDLLTTNIKDLYKSMGVDIEPSWHLVFLFLKKHKTATMSDLAISLQLSQPATTKMVNRMIQKGYLVVDRDNSDSRKKNVRLSSIAKRRLPKFERIWKAGQQTIEEMLADNAHFLSSIEKLEEQAALKSFSERALERLGER